ncbi:MAG: formyltransferase family protein [Alkalispirochaeta sp.]
MLYRLPPDRQHFRIVIVTQEDPFYIPLFFREFYRARGNRAAGQTPEPRVPIEIAGVMIQRALGNRTAKGLAKRIWRLYGTGGFLVMGVRYAWRRGPALLGRWAPTVAGYSRRAGVPLLQFESNDANGAEFIDFLRRESIDLVVSVSASQIFKEPVLSTPPLGCINLHNAPLPHYRGMLPNFRQLYHGEKESILTIHQMVTDLDQGDILTQAATTITDSMSLEQLMRETKRRSAQVLWDTLVRMTRDGVETYPLPKDEGSYYSWPTREEARELRRRGRRLL